MKNQLHSSFCYQSLFPKVSQLCIWKKEQSTKQTTFALNTLENPDKDSKLKIQNNFIEITPDL